MKKIHLVGEGYSEQEEADLQEWVRLWQRLNKKQLHPALAPVELEAVADQECRKSAIFWGTVELFEQSKTWPDFEKAWRSWLAAYERLLKNKLPALRGSNARDQQQQYRERIFLAGIELGREDPGWFQVHAGTLCNAALAGDGDFFRRFAEIRRRNLNPKMPLNFHLLACWMPAALWTATDVACRDFLLVHPEWKFKTRGTRDSVRQARMDLNLWHYPKPAIKGWQKIDVNGTPTIKPIFFPRRAPKKV